MNRINNIFYISLVFLNLSCSQNKFEKSHIQIHPFSKDTTINDSSVQTNIKEESMTNDFKSLNWEELSFELILGSSISIN